jgi:surfeit locus 1 family protein
VGLAVLAFAAFAMLVGLGTWQLDRRAWKQAHIAERSAMLARPPVELANGAAAAAVAEFRRVTLTGRFLHDHEVLIGPRARRGAPGWHVVTPLRLDSGRIVLVDRGWVPADRKDPAGRRAGQIAGPVTVVGVVRHPGQSGWFAPENEPAKGQWFRVDPAAMARQTGLPGVARYWVVAGDAPNPGGFPVGGGGIEMPPNNHLQYAVIWYGLAAALAVIAVVYWRRPTA